MSKKSYTPPSLKSEKIFEESSLSCLYRFDKTMFTCQKKTTACNYPPTVGYCTILPYNS
jgi:hypothetical protein